MIKAAIKSTVFILLFFAIAFLGVESMVVFANETPAAITSVSAKGSSEGVIYSSEKASIYGTGLSGQLTIKVGNQEPQFVQATGISDTYAEFIVPTRSQTTYTIISVTNSSGVSSNNYSVQIAVPTSPAPTITSVSAKAAPEGVVYSGEQATITGTNLSGTLSIKLGAQEPKIVQATGSGNAVSFTVPQYQQTSYVSITVTNSDGNTSNSLSVKIEVPSKPAPAITNIQSVGNPAGTVDAGKRAAIYGTGLSGQLTIKLGNIESRYVQTTGASDTYAEFVVPSYSQSVSVSVTVTNANGLMSNFYSLRVETTSSAPPITTQTPAITSISAKAAPEGVVYSGEQATITGTGLSGSLTITLGVQEARDVQATGSGNSVSFAVPQYQQTSYISVTVTNASGAKSSSYSVKIEVPKADTVPSSDTGTTVAAPVIQNIQSAGNPEGVVDAGRRAAIYGAGLYGPLTVKIGVENPQIITTSGKSDTYAEFTVPIQSQPVSTVVTVTNASGATSNAHRITIQVEGRESVESNSVEELIRKGGKYEASDLTEKAGALTIVPGAIRTNTMTVPTTETQLILDVGTRAVSVEPTSDSVLIRDKNLEVVVDKEITIASDGARVGNAPVSVSAGEVTEKFELTPEEVRLTTKGAQAVYDIQTAELRKLFGFIPIRLQITVVVSAENAELLQERRPWYSFLTTD